MYMMTRDWLYSTNVLAQIIYHIKSVATHTGTALPDHGWLKNNPLLNAFITLSNLSFK